MAHYSALTKQTALTILMKGTKVQTLGAHAVAGAWCMADCLGHNYYIMAMGAIINTHAHR